MLSFFYRYEEKLKERLAKRRERLAQGLPVDDEDEEDLEDGLAEGEEVTDVKAILEDLDKRYNQDRLMMWQEPVAIPLRWHHSPEIPVKPLIGCYVCVEICN